jgi:hypothetical protein
MGPKCLLVREARGDRAHDLAFSSPEIAAPAASELNRRVDQLFAARTSNFEPFDAITSGTS